MRPSSSFYLSYVLCLSLSVLCLLLVSCWRSYWRGGFAWTGSPLQFNWHPVLMVAGLVVLYGNAAVVYRVPSTWKQRKFTWKLVHAGLMLAALVLTVLGLHAVFDVHREFLYPDLYSLHSWVGISAVGLFAFQWLLGLAGFLLPCSSPNFRSTLKPVHVWMGSAVFVLSLIACISGIDEDLVLSLAGTYGSRPAEATFANSLGVAIVAFGLVVLGILSKNEWQRPADQETQHLLLSESNA